MFSTIVVRSLMTSSIRSSINTVTVIGAGIMGSGIAQIAAQSGHKVNLVDKNEDLLKKANSVVTKSLTKLTKKKGGSEEETSKMVAASLSNISHFTDALEAAKNSDLIIEAIVENRDAKRKLFAELDKVAPPSAIFVSNTSSFLIASLAEATNRKDRFAGLHFFNPVPIMKLVEIVCIPEVSPDVIEQLESFSKKIGKTYIKCKDNPGFVVNRLLVPHMIDAVLMAERGDATMEDIDIGMKLGCGYPMGPFELIDFSGLDTLQMVTEGWANDYPEVPNFFRSKLVAKNVAEGRFGVKTGKGFYDYPRK